MYKYNRANIEYACDLLHDELVRDAHRNHALSVSTIVPAGLRFFLVKQFPTSGWRCDCARGSESLSIFRGRCNLAQYCSELTRSTVGFYDIGRIFMISVFFPFNIGPYGRYPVRVWEGRDLLKTSGKFWPIAQGRQPHNIPVCKTRNASLFILSINQLYIMKFVFVPFTL